MSTATLTPSDTTETTDTGRTAPAIPPLVSFDLYRDIHKAIRSELFAVTAIAGSIDPDDIAGRTRHAERVHALADLLDHHASHEDANLDDVVGRFDRSHVVALGTAHGVLEARMRDIARLADAALASDDRRAGSHALYLELSAFTGSYLQHQDFEERVVMRLLAEHLDVVDLLALHEQILASVEPQVMGQCLTLMLPAINVVDRAEMLGGMRASAPAEVFAGVWALAADLLSTREYLATAARLGIAVDPSKIG